MLKPHGNCCRPARLTHYVSRHLLPLCPPSRHGRGWSRDVRRWRPFPSPTCSPPPPPFPIPPCSAAPRLAYFLPPLPNPFPVQVIHPLRFPFEFAPPGRSPDSFRRSVCLGL